MIQFHVNHMVRAIVCPKQVSMRIYYVWLCVQGGYGYVSSVGMYCKFEGTYLGRVYTRLDLPTYLKSTYIHTDVSTRPPRDNERKLAHEPTLYFRAPSSEMEFKTRRKFLIEKGFGLAGAGVRSIGSDGG